MENLELVVGGTLPVITNNFELLKSAIQKRLEPYKIQVTEKNLAEAKKLATELGKGCVQLKKLGKEKADEFEMPVKKFMAGVLELVSMIQSGQDFLKQQVKVFEDKTRALCKTAMEASLKGAYLVLQVRAEYQTGASRISEMVGISKVNPIGELTKAAKDAVFGLAQADRGRQDLIDGRIAKLEAACYAAGLKIPLSRIHVESILKESDSTYQIGLQNIIKIETDRQEKTLAREKERMEQAAKEKAESEARQKMAQEQAIEEAKQKAKQAAEKEAERIKIAEDKFVADAVDEPLKNFRPVSLHSSLSSGRQKVPIWVVVRFLIETARTTPTELETTRKYFQNQISSLSVPPFSITIEKGE